MLTKRLSKATFILCAFTFLLFSFSFLFFLFTSYNQLIHYTLNEINRPDLYEVLTTQYFTYEKFQIAKQISYAFSILSFLAFIALLKYKERVIGLMHKYMEGISLHIKNFRNVFAQNSSLVNILLLISFIIISARSIYYISVFYIQFDEAWNYNYFLHKNIFYSLFAYNNYPLHNLISWLFVNPLGASTFVLRLPSVIAGLISCLLIFAVIKKISRNEWIALSSTLLFSCLPVSVFYMLYARGVMLEIFFSILICYLLFQYLQEKASVHKIIFLAVLNALGTFSMLSHAYFIVLSSLAAFVYLILQKEKQFRFIILYPLLSVLFSAILLIPMISGTGISPGLNAGTADTSYLVLHYLPFHCYSDFMTGGWFVFYIITGLNIFFAFAPKHKEYLFLAILNLIFMLAPFIIKYSTGAFPPERALAFLVFSTVSTFAMSIKNFRISHFIYFPFTLVLIIILSYLVYNHPKLNWSKQLDKEVHKLAGILKANHIKSVYNENARFNYFVPGILYYYSTDDKELRYSTAVKGSTRYSEEKNTNTDCIIKDNIIQGSRMIYEFDSMYVYDVR